MSTTEAEHIAIQAARPQQSSEIEANQLQAFMQAKAEMEAELREIRLWHPVDDNELARLKRAIDRSGSRDLGVLVKAGIQRETLLHLLASAALESGSVCAVLEEMRRRQASLKSLGQRMKTIATEASGLLERASSNADWWFCLHGGGLAIGQFPPRAPRDLTNVSEAARGIEALSKMLDNEQRRFGRYLRAMGSAKPGIVQLLVNYWADRSAERKRRGEKNPLRLQLDHFDALARLLTDAFACAGKSEQSSADGLRQTFRRHVIPLLKLSLPNLTLPIH